MAQYDDFADPGSTVAKGIPQVVTIQSDQLDALAVRMSIPIAASGFGGKVPMALCAGHHGQGRAAARARAICRAFTSEGFAAPCR